MFSSFRPYYTKSDEIYNYVNNTLKGSNLSETVKNYYDFLNQVQGNLDSEVDVESIKNKFESLKTDEGKYEFFNTQKQYVLDILFDKSTKDLDIVKEVFYKFDIKVKGLSYIDYDSKNKTKEGLQNRLIELYKSVLLNEKVIPNVMNPVDSSFMKDDITNVHKEEIETNLSVFNPLKDIDTRYDFLAGETGVGQQANALIAHVLGSLSNLGLTNFNVPKSNNKLDSEFSSKLSEEDLNYYAGQFIKKDAPNARILEFKEDIQKIKVGDSLSAVLNAFVDIAKDPYITKAGWTTMTTNTGNLLLRYGVHPFYVNSLLSQSVIKEYVEFSQQYEKSDNQTLSTANAFIEQEFGKDNWKNTNKHNVLNDSLKSLRSLINKPGSEQERMNTFYSFLYFQGGSKALQKSVKVLKFMVDGNGKNITSLQISKNLVRSILEDESKFNNNPDSEKIVVTGLRSLFKNPNGSPSMLSRYYDNIIVGVDKIVKGNPNLFLSGNHVIQNTFNEISYSIYNEILLKNEADDALGDKLEAHSYSYLMSGFKPLNISINEKTELLTTFVNEFKEFKEENKGLYSIIDTLIVKPGSGKIDFITLNNRIKAPAIEESLTNSFSSLLDSEPEFAEKLIKYSYLTSGFSMNHNQFFTHLPAQWMMRNSINRYIIDVNKKYNDEGFNDKFMIDQFFLSNLENTKYVKNLGGGQYKTIIDEVDVRTNGLVMNKPGKQDYFKVRSIEDGGKIYYKLLGYTSDFRGVYTKFIMNTNNQYVDVQSLNIRDKKGNQIYSYSRDGIILKPSTVSRGKLADLKLQEILNNKAVHSRDWFYQGNVIPNVATEIVEDSNPTNEHMTVDALTPKIKEITEFVTNTEIKDEVTEYSEQQDLFSSAADNFEQVKEKWLAFGNTKEDWGNMSIEDREHIIKNCL